MKMSIYVGVFQYVFMKTLKHTCIKYKLIIPTRQTILQLTNMEIKLQDTTQVFFLINISMGFMQLLLLISHHPFYFQTFGNWCLNIKFYEFPKNRLKTSFQKHQILEGENRTKTRCLLISNRLCGCLNKEYIRKV